MIRRILRATTFSLRLQARARFPQVYLLVTVPVVLAFLFAVPATAVVWAFPLFLFAEPGMLGTNLLAAFRYLEQGEGTVGALMVTPLRPLEHLIGLALASSLLATGFGALTFLAVTGMPMRTLLVVPPLFGLAFLSSLVGFGLSMRFADFSRFVLGMIPWMLLWQLPLLGSLGVLPWPVVGWVPSTASLLALTDLMVPDPNVPRVLGLAALSVGLCIPGTLWVARTYERRIRTRAEFA